MHGEEYKETNSFNPIKCTIVPSYKHSKSTTYTAYSSILVMVLLYLNSYGTSNVISTIYAVYLSQYFTTRNFLIHIHCMYTHNSNMRHPHCVLYNSRS